MSIRFLLILCSLVIYTISADYVSIGLVYEHNNPEVEKVFEKAISDVNAGGGIRFNGISKSVTYGNAFDTSRKLCNILETGVLAIFGPRAETSANHAISICDAKEMPYIDTRWDSQTKLPTINLHPHPTQFALILRDIVEKYEWNGFTIIYESGLFLPVINELLEMYGSNGNTITVRRFDLDIEGNYRGILRRIKKSNDKRFVVVCSLETLPDFLRQAQEVGLMTENYQYIFSNLDLHTIDLAPYQYSDANITGIRLVNPDDELTAQLSEYTNASVTVNMALLYDGVRFLAETIKHNNMYQSVPISCSEQITGTNGLSLVNFMKGATHNGLTGQIKFDNEGLRSDFQLDVVELLQNGITKIGTWDSAKKLDIPPARSQHSAEEDDKSLKNKTFIVLISLNDPYGMLKETADKLEGNAQYEGFGIELIHELSLMLGFNYTFRLQEDSVYGTVINGSWNGMMREIMDGRADLAITDLTMTSDRENAVDFTMPFMNLGISILYRKPTKEPPKLFSFMSPFSQEVWLYLGASYIGVSLSLFILGRISPAEWDNPYPCIEEPTVLENQFSFRNSLWFTIGALLQQGSEIAPKAPSTRTVASIWWFFTLIMVSSYTANLAAFLTVENPSSPINSAEDLAGGNSGVKYGAKEGGSTYNFFRDANYTTYTKMYSYMESHKELLMSSNNDGVNKVETDNYAFLMESTSIEYTIERKCNLTQIGGLLDEKGYGIAMKKNSPYRDALSQSILSLQEQGKLSKLKTKWWKEKRGGGACAQSTSSDSAEELGMPNLGGVYFVLLVGSIFASVFGVFEWIFVVYKRARQFNVPFKEEFIQELKFVMRCTGNTRVVKQKNSSSDGSQNSSLSLESM